MADARSSGRRPCRVPAETLLERPCLPVRRVNAANASRTRREPPRADDRTRAAPGSPAAAPPGVGAAAAGGPADSGGAGAARGEVDGRGGEGHGVERERRAVGPRPRVAGAGRRRAVQLDEDGDRPALPRELLTELRAAQEHGDPAAGLRGAPDLLDGAAEHAVPLCGHRLHGQVDRGAFGHGGGAARRYVHHRHQGGVLLVHALHGRDVGPGADDGSDGGGQRRDAPGRGRAYDGRVAPRGADADQGCVGGDPLALLLGEDGGDLTGDGALDDITALRVGEDAGREERRRHGAGDRPDGRGRHGHDGDGELEQALRARETHRKVDLLR